MYDKGSHGGTRGNLCCSGGKSLANIFDLFKKIGQEVPQASPITRVVACLGNPGEKYTHTRHNCGFICADYLFQKYHASPWRIRFQALCAECVIGGFRTLIMKPQTYMNNSGEAVREALAFYKLTPSAVVVICDDISFACGRMRIRADGSDGGQRGLRSVIQELNTDKFPRIRLGAGQKPEQYDMADWVLSQFTKEEEKALFDRLEDAAEALPLLFSGEIETAMSRCNGRGRNE